MIFPEYNEKSEAVLLFKKKITKTQTSYILTGLITAKGNAITWKGSCIPRKIILSSFCMMLFSKWKFGVENKNGTSEINSITDETRNVKKI